MEKIKNQIGLNKFLFVTASALVVSVLGYVGASYGDAGGGYGGYGYGTNPNHIGIHVYRGFNTVSGDHFLTSDPTEYANLPAAGYVQEGVAFDSCNIGVAVNCAYVYRAWNPGLGNHFFTTNLTEWSNLVNGTGGWHAEGVAFGGYINLSDVPSTIFVNPVYREYQNSSGDHLFTVNHSEKVTAETLGYVAEGIGWYEPNS